ncbi:hypothetical protein D9M73_210070 [compost metagenome]
MLGQGAGAANVATALVVGQRRLNGREVEAPVVGELLVLASNDCNLELIGDVLPWLPVALQVDRFTIHPRLYLALDHQRRAGRWYPAEHQHQHDAAGNEPEQGAGEATDKR